MKYFKLFQNTGGIKPKKTQNKTPNHYFYMVLVEQILMGKQISFRICFVMPGTCLWPFGEILPPPEYWLLTCHPYDKDAV